MIFQLAAIPLPCADIIEHLIIFNKKGIFSNLKIPFPLCLPFDSAPGGFIGLNLHYLPPLQRAVLLGNLLDYTDKQLTEKSKIDVSWSLLKNFTKFPQAKPSIKRYLNNHVQSRFLKVEPQHWKAAIFLPTHNFVGANTRTVYQNSNKAMQ